MTTEDVFKIGREFLNVFSYPLIDFGESKLSIGSITFGVFLFVFFVYCSKLAEKGLHRFFSNRKNFDPGVRDSLIKFGRYAVVAIGALITLDTLGISLKSLAAIGAVLMVGVGFGLQNIAQNFISGIIILIERPIKIGDLVVVKGVDGKITSIGMRSTQVVTRNDVTIIVPNSQFISEQVMNDSFTGDKIRLMVKVGVAYGSDVELVTKILAEVSSAHPKVLNSPPPQVFFKDFGDSSLDFEVAFWVTDTWGRYIVESDIRFGIDKAFRKAEVTIPFPQRDVHLRQVDS